MFIPHASFARFRFFIFSELGKLTAACQVFQLDILIVYHLAIRMAACPVWLPSAGMTSGYTVMDPEVGWPPSDGNGGASGVAGGRSSRGMFWVHFKALVAKRATYGMRDKKSQFFQLIVPTLLFLLGLILLKTR